MSEESRSIKMVRGSWFKKGGIKPPTKTPRPNVTPGGRTLAGKQYEKSIN